MRYFFDSDEGEWHGIECWEERAQVCRELGYEVADLDINTTPLPYPEEKFDVVLASHVIEHLSDIDFCLKELNRVLKKGGLILVATPTKPPGVAKLIEIFHNQQSKRQGETQHAFSALSLRRFIGDKLKGYTLIDARGFRVLSMRKYFNLEDKYLFYKANTFLGKYLTFLVPEVNLIFKKPS